MEISQLFATLGFKVDNKGLEQFQSSIKGVQKSLGMLKNALYGFGLYQFTKQTMDAVVELDKLSKATDTSRQTLQEWQMVAEKNNISKNVIDDTFKKIADERSKILTGGKPNNYWRLLGIDPLGKPEESFKNILKQIEKIQDAGIRNQRLKQLGLSQDLLGLVGKNQKDYKYDYFSDLDILDDQQMNKILELNNMFKDLWQSLKMLKDYFVAVISPVRWFVELMTRTVHIIGTALKRIGENEKALKAFKIILVSILFYFKPMIAWITLLCGIVEDLWVYFNGGNSVIGELIKKYPSLQKFVNFIKDSVLWIIDNLDKLKYVAMALVGGKMLKGVMGLFKVLNTGMTSLIGMASKLVLTLTPILPLIAAMAGGAAIGKWIGKKGAGLIDKVVNSDFYNSIQTEDYIGKDQFINDMNKRRAEKGLPPINNNTTINIDGKKVAEVNKTYENNDNLRGTAETINISSMR